MSEIFNKDKMKLVAHIVDNGKELIVTAYRNNGHVVYGFQHTKIDLNLEENYDKIVDSLGILEEYYDPDYETASKFFLNIQTELFGDCKMPQLTLVKKEDL